MPSPPAVPHPLPLPANAGLITPHQLWTYLTPQQQQRFRQTLVTISQQWLAHQTGESPSPAEEARHDGRS
jgi:hypothetical protein